MKNLKRIAAGAFSALFWLSIWTLAAYICAKEVLLPSPLSVLRSLVSLASASQFWISCAMSLLRVCAGLAAGAVLGVACAAVSIRWKIGRALISPALSVIRATPVASFIILAFISIDTKLCEMAAVFRLPLSVRLRRIYIPSMLPAFAEGFKTSLGMAWKAGVAAEVLCTPARSIGASLNSAKVYLETSDMFAWTATVIILSMLMEFGLSKLLASVSRKYSDPAAEVSGND